MIKLIEFAIRITKESPPSLVTWNVLDIAGIQKDGDFCIITKKDGNNYFSKGSYRAHMNRWLYVLESKNSNHHLIARPSAHLHYELTQYQPDGIHLEESMLLDICEAIYPEKVPEIRMLWGLDLPNIEEDDDE